MISFPVTVDAEFAVAPAPTFDFVVPIDLTSIFTGHGPLPAVIATREQTGAWDAPGQTRTVQLSDGSSARERLTGYDRPCSFTYTVSDFSSVLGLLVASADGNWRFEGGHDALTTHVTWCYTFNPRSVLTAPIVWFIARGLWAGYMRKALALAKQRVEESARAKTVPHPVPGT